MVDEFGGTLGFVTLDDVIAEVMDEELGDEADEAFRDDDGSLVVDGEVTLNELLEDHGITLSHPDVTTIAGMVLAAHGTVPAVGVQVRVQGHELTVEAMQGRKITRIRVRTTASR